jgi:hypothetical protein
MNLKNVLRTYSLLRSLTNDESALLDTLRAMNDAERELLVELLVPATVRKPATKQQRKVEHCGVCDYTKRAAVHKDTTLSDYHEFQSSKPKSARAASLAEQIKTSNRPLDGGVSKMRCDREGCGEYADHNVHHLESTVGYHEFQPQRAAAVGAGIQSADTGPLP